MGRILAIDFGRKRCGIAVTDVLQISANGLPTVKTSDLMEFLKNYCDRESIDEIIIGDPRDMQGNPSESHRWLDPFIKKLKIDMPQMKVTMVDERFTSAIAHQEMRAGGFKKKQREEKGRADEMAAILILTGYLESKAFKGI